MAGASRERQQAPWQEQRHGEARHAGGLRRSRVSSKFLEALSGPPTEPAPGEGMKPSLSAARGFSESA